MKRAIDKLAHVSDLRVEDKQKLLVASYFGFHKTWIC